MIPEQFRWTTNDGRTLDIRWMDTTHLTNTVNLILRKNSIDRRRLEEALRKKAHNASTEAFLNMARELKARFQLDWRVQVKDGKEHDQITCSTLARESVKTMCMVRAMLDTNVFPGLCDRHETMKWLRHEPEVIFQQIENYAARPPVPEDVARLIAKFTEYRLERT